MAYGYRIEYVTTSRRDVVKGMKFPMSDNDGGYMSISYDDQAILDGFIQGIRTQKGERVMYPDYGTTLRARVFEPLTENSIQTFRQEIFELIARYFPKLKLESLRIGSNADTDPSNNNMITVQARVVFVDQPSQGEDIEVIITE